MRLRVIIAFIFLMPALAACGGGSSATPFASAVPAKTHRALLIGGATGGVYNALATQYNVSAGTGTEDPSGYDMVIFDGKTSTPQTLSTSSALRRFLLAGKAVVLLNATEAHREQGLNGILWAHTKGSSAGTIYFLAAGANGAPPREVEIEFPVHLISKSGGGPQVVASPDPAKIPADTQAWLAEFQRRFTAGAQASIDPAVSGSGQTVFSLDVVQPLGVAVASYLNTLTPGNGTEFCGNITNPNGWGSCNGKNPDITTPDVGGSFETMINVLLEPDGLNYMHKIITRQYAFFSTYPWPNPSWVYGYYMADSLNGTNNANIPLTTMLGFNDSISLSAGPTWLNTYPMAIVEAAPTANNNTSQLTTSYSHTEQVGLSVSGGYQAGALGLLGANWSDAWTWSNANTINITDWSNDVTQQNGDAVYDFWASGNTPDTWQNLRNATLTGSPGGNGYNTPGFTGLKIGSNYLNQLQQSGMVSQDETAWATSNGPVGPQKLEFDASATFTSGEVFQLPPNILANTYNYGNFPSSTINEPIEIDFSNPSLQPPEPAPWSLTFGSYAQTRGKAIATTTGTVTLNQPAAADTQINLSYVIQPQQQMLTVPASEACQGNTTSFNPGNSILNNGQPPLSITIPAGKASANFSLTFQTFNNDTYNVQVVAWLPSTDLGGQSITNPQSAWCLTPPNTLP